MSDRASALRADFKPGVYGDLSQGTGVTLTETFHDFVAEIAAFDSHIDDVAKLIRRAEARIEGSIAFQIAANRLLTAGPSKFRAALENGIDGRQGSFIDLSRASAAISTRIASVGH